MKIEESGMVVELRLNNTVFKCGVENKYYNVKDRQAYAVRNMRDVVPTEKGLMLTGNVLILCDKCYKDAGLYLEDPSPIVVPKIDAQKVKDSILVPGGRKPVKT